jgi:putative FmdB family regulatory protein
MPFYEYQCQACGAQVEVMRKITDAPLKKCPECGKSRLTKLISAPVFRLKGGGWYETDFKSDKENKRNLVETEKAESKPEPKADAKTEAKPEAKADTKSESKPEAKPEAAPSKKTRTKSVAQPKKKPVAKRKRR